MADAKLTVILAAGGTGGHIFPAIALAEWLYHRGHHPILCTDTRFAHYSQKEALAFLPVHHITSGNLQGSLWKKGKSFLKIARGYWQAKKVFRQHKPDVVIGFGGYPSFPTMLAATRSSAVTMLHEQNSVCGKVNALVAPYVKAIATTFPETARLRLQDKPKVHLTGNPVRSTIHALRDMPYPELQVDGMLQILVVGGSQGAQVFGEVIPEAIRLLPLHYRQRLRIDQQCREADIARVRAHYQEHQVNAEVAAFFNDMPTRLAAAHLVIGRAGASTLAELMVAGRPALLVPYPYATDNHQRLNANQFEMQQAGWVIPQEAFTPPVLAARLESFLQLPTSLAQAAARAKEMGQADATARLGALLERLALEQHTKSS